MGVYPRPAAGIEMDAPTSREIEIKKVRYTHDAMIDEIIAFPAISQGELASRFGYTQSWVSIIVNSDAFQERLAERKAVLSDPKIAASVEERLEGLARRSLDKLLERLDTNQPMTNSDLISAAKLGVGTRTQNPFANVTNYVVQLPSPAPNAQSWLETTSRRVKEIVDISPKGD